MLADEISPDSCRLWDVETNQKYDKDVFRQDIGDLIETYKAVLARIAKIIKGRLKKWNYKKARSRY